jgi:8-oxo-dGTP pyrophosphatase MutT (NUDIX family)
MPHIHTAPGQHDMATSAYIILQRPGQEPQLLVHMHKKYGVLMQIGGHIELDETPWHALVREIGEESGYVIEDLLVLQPTEKVVALHQAVAHPVPVLVNTHKIGTDHYHSDLSYAFVTDREPTQPVGHGESPDIRWYTMRELEAQMQAGSALADIVDAYRAIIEVFLPQYKQVSTANFSQAEPNESNIG